MRTLLDALRLLAHRHPPWRLTVAKGSRNGGLGPKKAMLLTNCDRLLQMERRIFACRRNALR
jgi:hypothetical protein